MALRIYGTVPEGQTATAIARVCGPTNAAIQPGDATSWRLRIFDLTSRTPNSAIYDSLDQYTELFNELKVDSSWTDDDVGYNFKFTVPVSIFGCIGGHTYQMVWTAQTDSFGAIVVAAIIKAERMTPA